MPLAANAYAIGPSLYDWEHDRAEAEAAALDARIDDFIGGFAEQNASHKSDRKYIEETMDEAMEGHADRLTSN